MSHSRKDVVGGHRKTEACHTIGSKRWGFVWGENGKRFAKKRRAKYGRRHNRLSIRDLELITPAWSLEDEIELEASNDFYEEYDALYDSYLDDFIDEDRRERERELDLDYEFHRAHFDDNDWLYDYDPRYEDIY